jgi:DNA polymerase-3 subunit delta
MKLSPRDASAYFKSPSNDKAGLLIFGADPMRVAARRQQVILALVGSEGEAEMRLYRLSGADLRKDASVVHDAIKAQGFFPGPRVVFVEEATDGLAKTMASVLAEWRLGDAQLIVTANALTAKSPLRKVFESAPSAYSIGIYDDPPSRNEVEDILKVAGVRISDGDVFESILALSRSLDPGDFRQTIEKIGLYKHGDSEPLTVQEVLLCAPGSFEAGQDQLLNVVADGRDDLIAPLLSRLYAQGVSPVGLCISATRHFRTLFAIGSDPGGASAGIGRLRPPVFGPRRDALLRQASQWHPARLEDALTTLTDTDLQLRSTAKVPAAALVERALIRIAWMRKLR